MQVLSITSKFLCGISMSHFPCTGNAKTHSLCKTHTVCLALHVQPHACCAWPMPVSDSPGSYRACLHDIVGGYVSDLSTPSMTRMTTMTRFPQTSANHSHGRLFRFLVILVIFVIQRRGISISTPSL